MAALAGAAGSGGSTLRGSRIAFGLERGTLSSVYTVRANGTGLRRLTVPPTRQELGGDSGPVWSPDGRRIVFERNLVFWGEDRFRLAAVPAAGGFARQLTRGPYDAMPTFSPDGRTVAFARLAEASAQIDEATLYLADANGSNIRALGDAPVRGVSPAWSPDGRRIAFVSFSDHNGRDCAADGCPLHGEIYVVGADGTGLARLTESTADDEHPTWSPDGSRIAFASGFQRRSQGHRPWLVAIPARGGKQKRIGRFSGVLDPSWSPAGVR